MELSHERRSVSFPEKAGCHIKSLVTSRHRATLFGLVVIEVGYLHTSPQTEERLTRDNCGDGRTILYWKYGQQFVSYALVDGLTLIHI